MNETNEQLYNRWLSGDNAALDTLMLRSRSHLTAYLNAIVHDPDDAEDLAMETFARIIVKRPAIREGGFRAYLYRVARNLALRFLPWRSTVEFLPEDAELIAPDTAEGTALQEERAHILRRCMDRVEPAAREALWLIYFEDLSYAQAAQVMKTGTKKIDNLLLKGRRLLKEELEKEGITDAHE